MHESMWILHGTASIKAHWGFQMQVEQYLGTIILDDDSWSDFDGITSLPCTRQSAQCSICPQCTLHNYTFPKAVVDEQQRLAKIVKGSSCGEEESELHAIFSCSLYDGLRLQFRDLDLRDFFGNKDTTRLAQFCFRRYKQRKASLGVINSTHFAWFYSLADSRTWSELRTLCLKQNLSRC